jgi:hypothetical protein
MIQPGKKGIATKYVYAFEWVDVLQAHLKMQSTIMFQGVKISSNNFV